MPHNRPQHPSGRPIRKQQITPLGFTRIPFAEPLTPGLRRIQSVNAIGFTATLDAQIEQPASRYPRERTFTAECQPQTLLDWKPLKAWD